MAWWGDSFNPEFDIDDLREDLKIVEIGISKNQAYKTEYADTDAKHRIMFSYWNDMAVYMDYYMQESLGITLDVGMLSEANLDRMTNGDPDNIIYQTDSNSKIYNNGVFWFKLYPNRIHLDGPDNSPNVSQNTTSEPAQITSEQFYAQDNPPNYYDSERAAAQQGEIDSANLQISHLTNLKNDCLDGVGTYPQLQNLADLCDSIIGRCNIAITNAQNELTAGSPPHTTARTSYLTTRLSELASDSISIDEANSAGEFIRNERYGLSDLIANIEYGSKSGIIGADESLVRLQDKKLKLEETITRYEDLE